MMHSPHPGTALPHPLLRSIPAALTLVAILLADPVPAQPDFADREFFSSGGQMPTALAPGDFDRDGRLDVVVYNAARRNLVLLAGDASGGFRRISLTPGVSGNGSPSEGAVAAGDFDADGNLDFVSVEAASGQMTTFFGNGRRRFPRSNLTQLTGRLPLDIAVGDLDGNGSLDLAVAEGDQVSVLLNPGDGLFSASSSYPAGSNPRAVVIEDVNGDASPDLIVSGANFFVLFGDDTGTFAPAVAYNGVDGGVDLVVEDVNGDGALDVVTVVNGLDVVSVTLGDGLGGFAPSQRFQSGNAPVSLDVADFDQDGAVDILTSNGGSRTVSVLAGDGTGSFAPRVNFGALDNPSQIFALDLDNDCSHDFIVGSGAGDLVCRGLNQAVAATPLDGTVNRGRGSRFDVLLLNGSAGSGPERKVEYGVLSPFELRVRRPPAVPPGETAPFAIYVWRGRPVPGGASRFPFGIGCISMPTPISGGSPQPHIIWNNARRFRKLGFPNRPSVAAPSVLVRRPDGPRRAETFTVQGVMFDPGSAADVPASVTNAIVAIPVFGGS